MFDSLLCGKFSKKCKHCIKCINSRLELIKKKKQATVKFLKKDVADLVGKGHDSNAFGRIEAIIVEINRACCYDMIENYCQCIQNLLPGLQKLRECPEEAKEAISTLIFAASRFSDLPELYDLRQVFTERYGSQMESSVNTEFVEKLQKKSFSTDAKLQLMRNIADEFSVTWDPRSFQQKISNPTQISSDKASISNSYNRRPSNIASNEWIEAINPHLHKSVSDAAVEKNFQTNHHNLYNRKEATGSPDVTITRRKETTSNSPLKARNGAMDYKSQKQQVHPEPKDIHVIPSNSTGKSHYPIGNSKNGVDVSSYTKSTWARNKTRKNEGFVINRSPIEKEPKSTVIARDAKEADMFSPYTISKGVRNGGSYMDNAPIYDDFAKVEKAKEPTLKGVRNAGSYMNIAPKYDDFTKFGKAKEPIMIGARNGWSFMNNAPINDDFTKVEKAKEPILQGVRTGGGYAPIYDDSSKVEKAKEPILKGVRNGGGYAPIYDDSSKVEKAKEPIYDELPRAEKRFDSSLFERSSKDTPRPLSMIPPPYTKSTTPNHILKPPTTIEKLHTLEREENEVKQGVRKHDSRRRHAMYDGDCDDEEDEIMDRLLKHLSRKGNEEESSKRRSKARVQHMERGSSLTSESVGRGPFRASSMQSDHDDLAARFKALKGI